jgi:hypothetical protein
MRRRMDTSLWIPLVATLALAGLVLMTSPVYPA